MTDRIWQPKQRHALIDGDIIAYSCAAVSEEAEHVSAALAACKQMMLNMRDTLQLDSNDIFLSPAKTFRNELTPSYKANRKDVVRPKYLGACKDYLTEFHGAKTGVGIEADDCMGIAQVWGDDDEATCICTIDKDLNQIPGWHWNWRRHTMTWVTPDEGMKMLWTQLLTGDSADGIVGIRGIGPKKAGVILEGLTTEPDLFDAVLRVYLDKSDIADFCLHYKLLKIWQTPPYNWAVLDQVATPEDRLETLKRLNRWELYDQDTII